MTTVPKGDIGELVVAADLAKRGYRVAMPFSTSCDWDLLLIRGGDKFERIQVKYAEAKDGVIPVRCRTHSNTSLGRVQRSYTADMIDWLAVYEPFSGLICYLPVSELTKAQIHLRIDAPKMGRGNRSSIRWAKDYQEI